MNSLEKRDQLMHSPEPASTPSETAEPQKLSRRFCWRVVAGLLAGIGFLGLPLHAENNIRASVGSVDGIYRGTIGNQEIVVEISGPLDGEHGENYADADDLQTYPIQGSYFYRRHGVSIDLVGTPLGKGVVRMRESWDDEFTAEWRLTMRGGRATGIFCRCDLSQRTAATGRLPKISLKRVSRKLTPDSGWEQYKPHSGNTYYDLLLDFPLQHGPEIHVNQEIAYAMRTDARFKISEPRLTRLPRPHAMAGINRDLDAEFAQNRLSAAAACSPGPQVVNCVGFYSTTTAVSVFPPDILSILVEFKWFSGGVHPGEGGYSINYNLHTGKRFTLQDAFQTSSASSAKAEVAGVLAKLYLRHYVKPHVDRRTYAKLSVQAARRDCEQVVRQSMSRKDEPFSPLLYLSQKGLVIEPILAHGDSECGPPVTVPYCELRPFVKRGSTLRLLIDARTLNSTKHVPQR